MQKPDTSPLPEVTVSEYGGIRSLHLDSIWVQGAMRISQPLQLELEYVQRMMAPLLWQDPQVWREGLAVQLLHIGAYTEEHENIMRMHQYAIQRGHALTGKHHEIYLSDPRRTPTEKLKTILRQPITRVE